MEQILAAITQLHNYKLQIAPLNRFLYSLVVRADSRKESGPGSTPGGGYKNLLMGVSLYFTAWQVESFITLSCYLHTHPMCSLLNPSILPDSL